jgi:hypothetical protein
MFQNGFWSNTAGDLVTTILQAILSLLLTPLNAITNGLSSFLNQLLVQ